MSVHKNIAIENIYYMLSYAYKDINHHCTKNLAAEKFENIADLFALILCKGISSQIKRGLHKEYIPYTESLNGLKGKLDFAQSIKENTLHTKKLVCNFDDFSENILLNKILKSTCLCLFKSEKLKKENKKLLKKILLYFSTVDEINLYSIQWNSISYHRNNSTYRVLITICYLVVHGLLLHEKEGRYKLADYFEERQLSNLYERFVLEYYKKHYPELKAKSSEVKWQHDFEPVNNYLPKMQSDIMLTYGYNKLIIDTKFYKKTMQERFGKESYQSHNLYQIFTYVKNEDVHNSGSVSGMLLYAKTIDGDTPESTYSIGGNEISIRTLDLDTSWENIRNKLNLIADTFISKSELSKVS